MKQLAIICVLAFAFGIAACDSGGDDNNNNNNGGGDTTGGGGGGGGDMCGGLCISGQYCWNGICVDGCLSNGDCADDQYCLEDEFFDQGKCVPKEAQGCTSNGDCEGTQVCKKGACVAPPAVQPTEDCMWKSDMTDGCPDTQVCFEEYDENDTYTGGECYSMPACGEDGSCPTTIEGGVCNVKDDNAKIIPSKSAICLMGLCLDNDDCPANQECAVFEGEIGACLPEGMMPEGCDTDDDCDAGEICELAMCVPDMSGGCETDDDCGLDEICEMGMCVPDFF